MTFCIKYLLCSFVGEGPGKNWPWNGEVALTNVSLQYGDTKTLKNLTCKISAAEKV